MKKTISIALIIIWMAVIFWFSSMPGDESNTKSKSTIKEAIEKIMLHEKAEKEDKPMSNEENEQFKSTQSQSKVQNQFETTANPGTKETETKQTQKNQIKQKEQEEQLIERLNKPLRKCMHASEYFVLSILIYNFLKNLKISGWKTVIISIGISFLYACTDEFHQLFVAGRTSQFTDVLIDTLGAIIGIAMVIIGIKISKKIKQQKSTKKFQKTIAQ